MAAPSIHSLLNNLFAEKGVAVSLQMVASNSPTSWAASGLPGGLSISSGGLISGTPTAEGVFPVTLTASNVDGDDSLELVFAVMDADTSGDSNNIAVDIRMDLVSGAITVLGIDEDYLWGPPIDEENQRAEGYRKAKMAVKKGDRFPALIGFTRNGELQDLDVSALSVAMREFATDAEIELTDGTFTKQGSGSTTLYEVVLDLQGDDFAAALSNYEQDNGTYLDGLAEIEFEIIADDNAYDSTVTSAEADIQGNDSETGTLSFTGIPQVGSEVDYTLTVDFTAFKDGTTMELGALSTEPLTITVPLTWGGAAFSVGTTVGDETVLSSAPTSTRWQTDFRITSYTGTATGVDIGYSIDSSDLGSGTLIRVEGANFDYPFDASGGTLDFGGEGISTTAELHYSSSYDDDFTLSHGDTAAEIETAINAQWQAAHSTDAVSDVIFDEETGDILFLVADANFTDVVNAYATETFSAVALNASLIVDGEASGRLAGDTADDVHRRSSETFILRSEADVKAND